VIADGLDAVHVVVGANFTFGHLAQGNIGTLEDLGQRLGFSVEGVALLDLDGRRISSSSIREAVAEGELAWPTRALGRRFALDGRVVRGAGRGADMGFPTANLEVPGRMLIPGRGIYAGRAIVDGGSRPAAIDVGTNPQFGGEPLHVEAHVLDFDGDLIGQDLAVEFWERLRDEERFDSVEDLVRQIGLDVERTRAVVAERSGA
jgi:riboflavin kinase/FMN adenylyltransferase